MENNVKHIAPNPTMTCAGTKYAMLTNSASDKYADKNKQAKAVITGIKGILLDNLLFLLHTEAGNNTLLEML